MVMNDHYWDKVAETWDMKILSKQNPHYHYYHTIDLLVAQMLKNPKVKKALELGCGTAQCAINVFQRVKRKNLHITGIDISPRMIELGKEHIENHHLENRITLEVGDVADLDYPDNKFDVVFSRGGVLSYSNTPHQVLTQAHRVLNLEGHIGIDVIPQPATGREYYIGNTNLTEIPRTPETMTEIRSFTYREFFTQKGIQIIREYEVQINTRLYSEIIDLFRELPPNQPGIRQSPNHLDEAKLISERKATLYNTQTLSNIVKTTGFNVIGVYGAGYANLLRKNKDLWEFVNKYREKFSQIELFLHNILCNDDAGMLFIIGKKDR